MKQLLALARRNGLAFLRNAQQNSGGFMSQSANTPSFDTPETYLTTFTTALILNCLNQVKDGGPVHAIRERAAAFLLGQRSPDWSFNYWVRNSAESEAFPYPDDADDTFCALAALPRNTVPVGEMLAAATNLLVRLETAPGGPYRTWFYNAWRDVDLAVNANIAYFLQNQHITLRPLLDFLDVSILANTIGSPYYPSRYPLYYFLSRLSGLSRKTELAQSLDHYVATRRPQNPLEWSLAALSALRLESAAAAEYTGQVYGLEFSAIARPYAFWLDPALHGQTHFSGSAALSVAVYLEAMSVLFRPPPAQPSSIPAYPLRQNVIAQVRQQLSSLPQLQQETAGTYIQKLIGDDDRLHIIGLVPRVIKAFGVDVSPGTVEQLSSASLWGWLAYTLYDDIADEGRRELLPLAQFCRRELDAIYAQVFERRLEVKRLYARSLAGMETAARRRTTAADLISKNQGVVFSGLAALFAARLDAASPAMRLLEKFLSRYVLARQLNDDAHDWQEDLAAGIATPVTELIEKTTLPEVLPSHYWTDVVPPAVNNIRRVLSEANDLLTNELIIDPDPLRGLLVPLEAVADRTLIERRNILDFLNTYHPR